MCQLVHMHYGCRPFSSAVWHGPHPPGTGRYSLSCPFETGQSRIQTKCYFPSEVTSVSHIWSSRGLFPCGLLRTISRVIKDRQRAGRERGESRQVVQRGLFLRFAGTRELGNLWDAIHCGCEGASVGDTDLVRRQQQLGQVGPPRCCRGSSHLGNPPAEQVGLPKVCRVRKDGRQAAATMPRITPWQGLLKSKLQ